MGTQQEAAPELKPENNPQQAKSNLQLATPQPTPLSLKRHHPNPLASKTAKTQHNPSLNPKILHPNKMIFITLLSFVPLFIGRIENHLGCYGFGLVMSVLLCLVLLGLLDGFWAFGVLVMVAHLR
jgi:hypothetical protein